MSKRQRTKERVSMSVIDESTIAAYLEHASSTTRFANNADTQVTLKLGYARLIAQLIPQDRDVSEAMLYCVAKVFGIPKTRDEQERVELLLQTRELDSAVTGVQWKVSIDGTFAMVLVNKRIYTYFRTQSRIDNKVSPTLPDSVVDFLQPKKWTKNPGFILCTKQVFEEQGFIIPPGKNYYRIMPIGEALALQNTSSAPDPPSMANDNSAPALHGSVPVLQIPASSTPAGHPLSPSPLSLPSIPSVGTFESTNHALNDLYDPSVYPIGPGSSPSGSPIDPADKYLLPAYR